MKIIDFLKELKESEDNSLFYDDDDYERLRKIKIIAIISGICILIFLILLIFTLCTMFLATDPHSNIEEPPLENPEF